MKRLRKGTLFATLLLLALTACVRPNFPSTPTITPASPAKPTAESTLQPGEPLLSTQPGPAVQPSQAPAETSAAVEPAPPAASIFGATLRQLTDPEGLQTMLDAGSHWTRRDFPWAAVEPAEGQRQWENVASLEEELKAAAEKGMEVVLILGTSPAWAMEPNHPDCGGRITQASFAALSSFTRDLVERYSQAPYNVHYYELWNEPEVYSFLGCWGEPSDPLGYYGGVYYGQMLQEVYPAMKEANPQAQVLIGGLLLGCDTRLTIPLEDGSPMDCSMTTFFEGILESGAGSAFDGVSFHAYDYYSGRKGFYSNANFDAYSDTTGPATTQKYQYLLWVLNRYQVSGKFFINTEIGLICGSCNGDPDFEATKAYYLADAYAASLADGYRGSIWYSAFGERNSGLLTPDLQPLPAYYTFQFLSGILNGVHYLGQPDAGAGLRAYEFTDGTRQVVMLRAADGNEHHVALTVSPQALYRIGEDGKPSEEALTKDLLIGLAPLIVVIANDA